MLLGSRALPAAAISRLLSDRGESVPTFVMTGLPMSLLGLRYYSVFKAFKPRPLGGAVPFANSLGAKQNPLTRVGRRYHPNLLGATLSPPRFSTRFRSSAREVYHQPPGCQSPFRRYSGYSVCV